MKRMSDVEDCVAHILEQIGFDIVLGVPLGLGKPNQLVNALYRRAKSNPEIQLHIITALSLEKPRPKNEIEAKLLVPFIERVFGGYHELVYMNDQRNGQLPDNVRVSDFYFKAGSMKHVERAQKDYICTNYTFVCRELLERGVNVLAQMVARKEVDGTEMLSLGSNPDVTLDIVPKLLQDRVRGRKFVSIAQVHEEMPFMYNKAMVPIDYFDVLIDNPNYNTTLFAPPNMSVPMADYVAGLHISALIKDGGTLQIGIGSLGDAIVYACQLRHKDNARYRELMAHLEKNLSLIHEYGGLGTFEEGLYGCSEMFIEGFLHLIQAGVIKREVFDDISLQKLLNAGELTTPFSEDTFAVLLRHGVISSRITSGQFEYLRHWGLVKEGVAWSPETLRIGQEAISNDLSDARNQQRFVQLCMGESLKNGIHMHGGFFLGSRNFYQSLRDLTRAESKKIGMNSIGHINQLDLNVPLYTAQRQHARFINTGMMVTLSGAVVSDGLENGMVVSGVGGQYNFVAQAHALVDARSILCIRSTRTKGKEVVSNIVPFYGHTTIPRHLRDIIVTEFGVADLRGATDEEIIMRLLNVTDSRFQADLMAFAKKNGKLSKDYEIPTAFQNNTPQKIASMVEAGREQGLFPAFPMGTDFTDEEIALGKSLREMKKKMESPRAVAKALIRTFIHKFSPEQASPFLERMSLKHPKTAKETLVQQLLLLELEDNGYLKPL
ncbi:MAG: acetyl-CoA hydrolase/transferase C-terminal domain-containing protein [Myxococcota bacterium]|nr:acetyl-CoA hydrolase/transferase C-terminal domain-containing protein [Myxococcota bacterium]